MENKLLSAIVALVGIALVVVIGGKNLSLSVPQTQSYGSVTGPNIDSSYLSVNGVTTEFRGQRMYQATTTVCALRAPTNATSTLRNGNVFFGVSSTTASTVTVAKATSAFATTTLIRTVSIAANGLATFPIASTSAVALSQAQADLTFAPGEYLVVGMAGGIGTFSPTGTCQAEFLSTTR